MNLAQAQAQTLDEKARCVPGTSKLRTSLRLTTTRKHGPNGTAHTAKSPRMFLRTRHCHSKAGGKMNALPVRGDVDHTRMTWNTRIFVGRVARSLGTMNAGTALVPRWILTRSSRKVRKTWVQHC